ncbi:unnamed protein product [Symbiodinium sp. CCMP2592]|nr:unnamed protein product [Symbiodinium sp. CCMP2592]
MSRYPGQADPPTASSDEDLLRQSDDEAHSASLSLASSSPPPASASDQDLFQEDDCLQHESDAASSRSQGLLSDDGANQQEDPGGRSEWNQGRNTGHWISRQAPLLEQGQVLLVNAVRNCGRLSVELQRPTWRQECEVTVRLALGCAYERQGQNSFERAVARHLQAQQASGIPGQCQLQGLALTGFYDEAIYWSARVLQEMDALQWSEPLNGLGIPSDFALLIDPVNMDAGAFSRQYSLAVVALCICSPSTGGLVGPMVGAEILPFGGHNFEPLQALIQKILDSHPAGLGLHSLRGRCACVGGDGQIVRGGSAAAHGSSGVAERLWQTIHEDGLSGLFLEWEATAWDRFHVADICLSRAVRSSPSASEVLQIVAELDTLFGVGEGKVLFESVANRVGIPFVKLPRLSGTRKMVYLRLSLVKNFKLIVLCLHARIHWKHEGKGSATLERLLSVSRRVTDISFVSFLVPFEMLMEEAVSPYVLISQKLIEPRAAKTSGQDMLRKLRSFSVALDFLPVFLTVLCLLRQHVGESDLRSYAKAMFSWSALRPCRMLLPRLMPLIFDRAWAGSCEVEQDVLDSEFTCDFGRTTAANAVSHLGLFVRLQVPLWTNARLDSNWPCHMPRYQLVTREEASQQQGVTNIFRVHVRDRRASSCPHTDADGLVAWRRRGACPCSWTSRCKVPLGVYESHRHILEGLAAMRQFVIDSIGQLSEGLTNKAYNAEMLQVLDACDDCFDWGFLCFQRPLKRHADAFRNVLGMLKPFLQHSLWPPASASDYALVKRTWDLPENVLLLQYGWLCERVRCTASLAFRRQGWSGSFDGSKQKTAPEEVQTAVAEWFVLQSVSVRSLYVLGSVEALVGKKIRSPSVSVVSLKKIASAISLFCGSVAGSTLPASAYEVFQLSPSCHVLGGD